MGKRERMNFSDKVKDEEFMNLPEVEDDIEEETEEEEFSLAELFRQKEYTDEELKDNTDKMVMHTVYHFMQLDKALFNEGFTDKDERYRIIEIIWR